MPSLPTVDYHPEKKKKGRFTSVSLFANRFLIKIKYYFKNEGECFITFPNTRKQMKRPSAFIVFECLETQ